MRNPVKQLQRATKFSLNGLVYAWRSQWAIRAEILLLIVAIPCAMLLATTAVEGVLLIGSVLLLLIVELLNTAVELTVDRIGMEEHPLSGLAKDVASAAIFLTAVNALLVWAVLLYSRVS